MATMNLRTTDEAGDMREAAGALVDSLDAGQRQAATFDLHDEGARSDWAFTPRTRAGLSMSDLGEEQRELVHELISAGTAAAGHSRVVRIIALEAVLARIENDDQLRDPMKYSVSLFGHPRDDAWSWRFEGHHVSLNVTVAGDRLAATPSFLGANPALHRDAGRVVRPLGREEDLGRALVNALDPASLARAVTSDMAPPEILTSNRPFVEAAVPAGVPVVDIGSQGRELVGRLLETWAVRLPDTVARAELDRLDGIDGRELHFAWAGGIEPGTGQYYRLSGPRLLLEYDNTQNRANHIHTVWRDPEGDFGRDVLREHLANHHADSAPSRPAFR
jgi:hypothetical protein